MACCAGEGNGARGLKPGNPPHKPCASSLDARPGTESHIGAGRRPGTRPVPRLPGLHARSWARSPQTPPLSVVPRPFLTLTGVARPVATSQTWNPATPWHAPASRWPSGCQLSELTEHPPARAAADGSQVTTGPSTASAPAPGSEGKRQSATPALQPTASSRPPTGRQLSAATSDCRSCARTAEGEGEGALPRRHTATPLRALSCAPGSRPRDAATRGREGWQVTSGPEGLGGWLSNVLRCGQRGTSTVARRMAALPTRLHRYQRQALPVTPCSPWGTPLPTLLGCPGGSAVRWHPCPRDAPPPPHCRQGTSGRSYPGIQKPRYGTQVVVKRGSWRCTWEQGR